MDKVRRERRAVETWARWVVDELRDDDRALKLVGRNGVVIWHDYGIWEGVTQALEEIEREKNLGLESIRGTSLVYWRNGKDG